MRSARLHGEVGEDGGQQGGGVRVVAGEAQKHLEDSEDGQHKLLVHDVLWRLLQVGLHQDHQRRDVAVPAPVVVLQEGFEHRLQGSTAVSAAHWSHLPDFLWQ